MQSSMNIVLRSGARYLDVLAENQIGELKVGGGSPRQMNQQQAVHTLPVFVEDHKISESPVTSVGGDLFQGEALQMFAYGPSLLRG
jgi:hypothetical protein